MRHAPVILTGAELRKLRKGDPGLASAAPTGNLPASQITQPNGRRAHCGC